MAFEDDLRARLRVLSERGLLRQPPVLAGESRASAQTDAGTILVFCSNDYLGLADHPTLAEALRQASSIHGIGAGASRLISGSHPAHLEAEAALAGWVKLPAALLFSTGYAANVGALSSLLGREDVAFSDRLNHASLIDGLRLSRANVHVYDHGDLGHLGRLLRAHRSAGRRALIVTDTLFSMDGDLADLQGLRDLADEHDAALYVDEAHALGVLGAGRGACHDVGVVPDVLVGTLGKAAGVMGAFAAGSPAIRAFLENRARSYVFSTAPPPAIAATITAAVDLVRSADDRRARVLEHAARVRTHLATRGWSVMPGASPIIPVLIGDPQLTMRLSEALLERGFFVQGIRPPTVPVGTSRLRIVPTAAHTPEQVGGLLAAFDGLRSIELPAAE
ncbi:MAG: 8-amino-7-oxononanoate synthase [Myxococcales bacterium]|nr:8-amino-7-oxononanoate synthase [Myxococcales bacterium]